MVSRVDQRRTRVSSPFISAWLQASYVQEQEKTVLHHATVPILHERVDKKDDGLFEGNGLIFAQCNLGFLMFFSIAASTFFNFDRMPGTGMR